MSQALHHEAIWGKTQAKVELAVFIPPTLWPTDSSLGFSAVDCAAPWAWQGLPLGVLVNAVGLITTCMKWNILREMLCKSNYHLQQLRRSSGVMPRWLPHSFLFDCIKNPSSFQTFTTTGKGLISPLCTTRGRGGTWEAPRSDSVLSVLWFLSSVLLGHNKWEWMDNYLIFFFLFSVKLTKLEWSESFWTIQVQCVFNSFLCSSFRQTGLWSNFKLRNKPRPLYSVIA